MLEKEREEGEEVWEEERKGEEVLERGLRT